ncbi:DUF5312 family protein [Treponema sp. OMZ 791]|uniref:DUF5312 family protein n=1 Tax=unclassified Treponema TaxID=2638727 RepID=UPI0021FA20D4|nr:hypothetical protein E4O06_13715 [Treponema sp. OMZ 789]UTC69707.1 hypothetical protein E4O01_13855 [Treponema sp. OMZ 790]UTC72421.1 hypothetical protein E4O02_13945 [Treponema sp. OMZ 791]
MSSDSPEAMKRRKLKDIAKQIGKTRYSKWYKSNSQEVLPQAAQFFYNVYKVVGPARPLLAGAASSKVLKNVTVENSLSEKQKKLLEHLSEESIIEQSKNSNAETLAEKVKKELKIFIGEFDSKQTQKIDLAYQHLDAFIHFVLFDYYFLLRKFDSNFIENNFNYTPNFQAIRGEYITEDLKDFASVFYQLSIDTDWNLIFDIIKTYKNIQPVHAGQWKKLLGALNDLRRSKALEYIIQHITEDIFYTVETSPFTEKVTDTYVSQIKTSTQNVISKLIDEQRSSKVAVLINKIFGNQIISGMKNYTVDANAAFEKRGLSGYIYAEEMSYLKSFLIEYIKTDIRTLCDLFLVRGNWGSFAGTTADFSNSFHAIMQVASKTVEFDEKLSEVSDTGVKFRTLLSRMEREKEAGRQATKLLNDVNETALKLINISLKHIIVIGNNFKTIIADYDKPRRELIQNWKEIEQHSERPVREWLVEAYKKIYDFIMLMQLFIKKE